MAAPKTKGEFSTLTSDGRAVVDLDQLLASERVQTTLAVLDSKILRTGSGEPSRNSILHILGSE